MEHYTSLLMYRAGLLTADEYLKDVNGTVTRYLTKEEPAQQPSHGAFLE